MGRKTRIEWATATWNPVTGCTPISDGCANCYADRQAQRLQAMGAQKYKRGFEITIHPGCFDEPARWQRPETVFVCSMSDLFHEKVPDHIIRSLFSRMAALERHTFLVLTKRPNRMLELPLDWAPNIRAGVTVESEDHLWRIGVLHYVPALSRFVSFEPLLGPMPEDVHGWLELGNGQTIDQIIVGGESGPNARRIHYSWVLHLRDVAQGLGIAFFFKQWGGRNKARNGRRLCGLEYLEQPTDGRLGVN